MGFITFTGNKSSIGSFINIIHFVAWVMMFTFLAGISLSALIFIIIGWFKITSYFYLQRFGERKISLLKRLRFRSTKTSKRPIGLDGFRFRTDALDQTKSDFDFTKVDIGQEHLMTEVSLFQLLSLSLGHR